jgi:hypothetical protein
VRKVRQGTDRHVVPGLYFVTFMAKKTAAQPLSTNLLDYPESMSLYERESLVAEARLAAEREIKKRPKSTVKSE